MFRKVLLSAGLLLSIAANASAQVRIVTESNFYREVMLSERPGLIDFTAAWCPPCREMQPRLERLADEHTSVKVVQIDVDASPRLAERFGVESIPMMVIMFGGVRIATSTGAVPYAQLHNFLHDNVDGLREPAPLAMSQMPEWEPRPPAALGRRFNG